MAELKPNFFRHITFYFLLTALFISAICTYKLKKYFYPYQFTILETMINTDGAKSFYYHDFDKDGFSELLEINNRLNDRYFIYFKNYNGGTIDQANYWEPVNPTNMLFEDITGDGYDEIFTFTQDEDSTFIYVHDVIAKKVIINRQFLIKTEAPLSSTGKYVKFFPAGIADKTLYKKNIIIFAIRSSAKLPRAVYAFDLDNLRIIKQFETNAPFTHLYRYDLTGNGVDEIVITSSAWGNIHDDGEYKDDQCWLFVLDQKLVPVFPPLSFSEFPAELASFPLEINTERYLLVIPDYHGHKNVNRMMYLIDKSGKIHLRTQNPFTGYPDYNPILSSNENPSEVYGWLVDNELIKLNHRLEVINKVNFPYGKPRLNILIDINTRGKEEIVFFSENNLTVFDSKLNLMSVFAMDNFRSVPSLRGTGPANPPEIGVQFGETFYRLGFNKNKLFFLYYFLFIGITGTGFLTMFAVHKFLVFFIIYKNVFKRFLYDSTNGIIITNQQGKIKYVNNRIHTFINLPHAPMKGENLEFIFNQYPQILEIFRISIKDSKPIQRKITLGENAAFNEIEISVNPFGFFTKSCSCCLIEFKSSMPAPATGKIQTWSKTVQKMAHDIKTPLSTVALNLKVLQIRLEKINLTEVNKRELSDDIHMMRTELENIRSTTKNFLKFSNLDKPHFQVFSIQKIIDKTYQKYKPYITPELMIQISIDEDIKPVWVDPQQIELVFHILIENALAAIQGKGIINISACMAQYLENDFLEAIEIEVADTGPGINEDDKHQIFEPYFTTKMDGTGMGLAIAKKIIEDHQGKIEVYSKENFGAVFRFSLPAAGDEEKDE